MNFFLFDQSLIIAKYELPEGGGANSWLRVSGLSAPGAIWFEDPIMHEKNINQSSNQNQYLAN